MSPTPTYDLGESLVDLTCALGAASFLEDDSITESLE